jgi:hypothetical protein
MLSNQVKMVSGSKGTITNRPVTNDGKSLDPGLLSSNNVVSIKDEVSANQSRNFLSDN